jgi:hypothetical protein
MQNDCIKYVMRYSWFNYRLNWRDVFNLACGKLGKQRASKKKLAETNKKKEDVKPCRHCGQSSFNWDFILMIKTCKNDKCGDVSGVM